MPAALAAPWRQVWSGTFNGPAGSGVSTAKWKYDIGRGIFGAGDFERTTSDPVNVHLDGYGDLDIVPLRNGSSWTSGRTDRPVLTDDAPWCTARQDHPSHT